MQPLIGIPQCLDAQGRWKRGRTYQYGDTAYARAVAEAGGTPVHLAIDADPLALIARLDGLLVPGGDDLLPPRAYPEHVRFEAVPPAQLAFDSAVLDAAAARALPTLGICYGMQLLALRRSGSLHYDIPTDVPSATPHQLPDDRRHAVRLEPGTRLARILATAQLEVNSRHHQAVDRTGPELRVCAQSGDGIVEAVEGLGEAFCLGVQWHPETLSPEHRARLFGAFVAACR